MSYDDYKLKTVSNTWVADPLDGGDPVWCRYCDGLVEDGDQYNYDYDMEFGYSVWHRKCRPQ